MPYVAVPDKNAGDTFTQAMWATYLEGNLNAGVDRPLYDSGVLLAPTASIIISSIPATFAHLKLEIHGRGDTAALSMLASLRFNGDTTAIYYGQRLSAAAATVTAAESLGLTSLPLGDLPAASAPAGIGGSIVVHIPGYASGSLSKGVTAVNSGPTGTTTGTIFAEIRTGFWNSGAIINQITILPSAGNFAAGSRFTLTGVAYI